jgi:hypothetical protein
MISLFSFLLDQKRNKKIFMRSYCFFGIHESSISSLQIKSLKTIVIIYLTATGSPPFNFKCSAAQAVRPLDFTRGLLPLHFFVVFYAFYLRA